MEEKREGIRGEGGGWRHEGVKGLGVNNLLEEIQGLSRDGEDPCLVVGKDFFQSLVVIMIFISFLCFSATEP